MQYGQQICMFAYLFLHYAFAQNLQAGQHCIALFAWWIVVSVFAPLIVICGSKLTPLERNVAPVYGLMQYVDVMQVPDIHIDGS